MWQVWSKCLLLLRLSCVICMPSGRDVQQFLARDEPRLAASAVRAHPRLAAWRDDQGWSLVHHAAFYGAPDAINTLVKAGAEVDLKDPAKGITPLMVAVERGHAEALAALLNVKANANTADKAGVGVAARARSGSLLQTILNAGANLDHQDNAGDTAIMSWVREGRNGMVMEALKHCPDLTLANSQGLTALNLTTIYENNIAAEAIEEKFSATCIANGIAFPIYDTRYDGCYEVTCGSKCLWVRTGYTDPSCSDTNNHHSKIRRPRVVGDPAIDVEGKLVVTIYQTVRQAECP